MHEYLAPSQYGVIANHAFRNDLYNFLCFFNRNFASSRVYPLLFSHDYLRLILDQDGKKPKKQGNSRVTRGVDES